MEDRELLKRIRLDPAVMVGKAAICATRLGVEYVLNLLAHGAEGNDVVEQYEGLTPDKIEACPQFASGSL